MAEEYLANVVIAASHPCLAGHFPGDPIVPGVLILEEIERALADWQPGAWVTAWPMVKFITPLRPAQLFTLHLCASGARQVRFICRDVACVYAQGHLVWALLGEGSD